jgi:hypothetical protein
LLENRKLQFLISAVTHVTPETSPNRMTAWVP